MWSILRHSREDLRCTAPKPGRMPPSITSFILRAKPRRAAPRQIHCAAGKYLADNSGKIHYLVDPGINGTLEKRDPRPGEVKGQRS